MKTNITYQDKNFVVVDNAVVCNMTAVFNPSKTPVLKTLLETEMAQKMLKEKHCIIDKNGNVVMNVTAVARFNPSDEKNNYQIGCNIAEDRAAEKALRKVCNIYRFIWVDVVSRIEWECENFTPVMSLERMEDHNDEVRMNPQMACPNNKEEEE